ncbi:MAG TPA: glycosyltransferase [Acidimicrobiales bacterium]
MTAVVPLTIGASPDDRTIADVEIAVPVHNEERGLEASIRRLHSYLSDRFPLRWTITIADNASRDQTWGIACRLAQELPGVGAVHLNEKGRGRALRAVWSASNAPVVAYMDVDLSTDLDALLPLVAPLLSGHSDVAIGSRLAPGASVVRGPKREIVSRAYNLVLKATLHNGFSDAQCGFKAVRADVARGLLDLVEDEGWFFDTELLILAEHNGLRIHEVPVDWVDDPDSRVHIASTAGEDLRGIWRMLRRFAAGDGVLPTGLGRERAAGGVGQMVRFAGVGALTTLLFAACFLALTGPLGPVAADVVALTLCVAVNTGANRRLTFARRGGEGRSRHYAAGLAVAALPLVMTVVTLGFLGGAGVEGPVADLVALTLVNAAATAVRFPLLRHWVFR